MPAERKEGMCCPRHGLVSIGDDRGSRGDRGHLPWGMGSESRCHGGRDLAGSRRGHLSAAHVLERPRIFYQNHDLFGIQLGFQRFKGPLCFRPICSEKL